MGGRKTVLDTQSKSHRQWKDITKVNYCGEKGVVKETFRFLDNPFESSELSSEDFPQSLNGLRYILT